MNDEKKSWLDRAGAVHLWKTIEAMLGTKVDKIRYSANEFDYNFYFVKIWSGTHNK